MLSTLPLPVLIPYIVVGICVYSGLNHLLIFTKNPTERIHGIFSAMCFLIAMAGWSSSHFYRAADVEEAVFYLRILVGVGQVFFLCFLWFVALYTAWRPIGILVFLSGVHLLAFAWNLFSEYTLLFREVNAVSDYRLASGNTIRMITSFERGSGIYLFSASYLLNILYDLAACFRFRRRGAGISAYVLGVALLLFFGTVTHDVAMAMTPRIVPVTWSEYGFLAVIVMMSLKISSDYYRREKIQSEDKYRRLVEGLQQDYFIYSKSADGHFEYLSPSVSHVFDRPIEEMIGGNWRRFLDLPESIRKGNEAETICRGGERPEPFEIQILREDGRSRVIEIQERPVVDSEGNVISIEGIGKDVTRAKEIEKELTAARDSLRQMNLRLEGKIEERTKELLEANRRLVEEKAFSDSLLESLPGVFYLIRPNGRFVRWNRRFEEVTGYDSEEMEWIENVAFFRPEDLPALREAMEKIFRGEAATLECEFVAKDGNSRPYFFTGDLVHLRGEDLLIGMGIDVSEKKTAEEEHRRAHRLLDLHIDNSPLGVIGWDADFRVTQWSRKSSEIFGWTLEEAMGKHWSELPLVHPNDMKEISEVAKGLTSGRVRSKTILSRNLRKDGEILQCEWHNSVLLDESESVVSIFSLVQDVTEKKRIEDELRRHREDLEELIRERTRALEKVQRELAKQERLAAIGQVMATISHELRNPLGTIRGSFYTVGERVRGAGIDGLDRPLDRIDRNLKRCDRIIDELLDFVRNQSADRSRVRLDAFLEEAAREFSFPDGVDFEYHPGVGDRAALLDVERFRRCLVNLLNNAAQAVTNGTASDPNRPSSIRMETCLADQNTAIIRIVDTGTGIPEDLREKVFEPLFSTKSLGIGLGLHIVRNLMEQLGGGIEIEESSNAGTTMKIQVPVE
ncbi:MAG: PAS domain S-box protein [Candidatus Omnitrophica bacterium]|nr:PAS domain S-box protein [Candidatus Omnitrophota bacterium]